MSKTDFRKLIKFHKLLKLKSFQSFCFLNLDLSAIHPYKTTVKISLWVVRQVYDQKLAFTTLKMICTCGGCSRSCDATYRVLENKSEITGCFSSFLSYLTSPRNTYLKLTMWFNAILGLKWFLFLLKPLLASFLCARLMPLSVTECYSQKVTVNRFNIQDFANQDYY